MRQIVVNEQPIEPAGLMASLEGLGGGAVASFTGIVRGGDGLETLRLDHYPAMTESQIGRIVEEALERWALLGVVVQHRVGVMQPGERIVFVGAASRHRGEALDACAFLIDWLKTSAPFWKKESFADGAALWVEAREQDEAARARWD